ncbi:MAG: cysteine peptidase family C39 domain-containing protein [Bacteroidales bacterium]
MKSFPYHRQFDSMQCGIACLQMICEHFGKKYSPDTVAQYCYATTFILVSDKTVLQKLF